MAVTNTLQKSKSRLGMTAYLTQDAVKNQINQVIGGKNGQRFISAVVSAVNTNPMLQECTNQSVLAAALLGESLNLSPSPQLGQYYMVPFNDKNRGKVAQFQLGYKGYIQLAIRSDYYKKLNVLAIKEGELVKFDPLNEEIAVNLVEDDIEREALPTIGYYAMFEYKNGFKKAIYWSRERMMSHADKYSMAFSAEKYKDLLEGKIPQGEMWKYSSFWYKDFDGMAYKTMLRQLISKWGIMSIDLQTAIDKDMAAINEDGTVDYVDNSSDAEPLLANPETGEVVDVTPEQPQTDPTAGFFED